MRIQAAGDQGGRLAKLALVPAAGLLLAACGEQANNNPTSDSVGPSLIGETANGIGFPHDVVTTEGIASAGLYLPIFLIAVAIFVLIEGLLLFMAWRFRRRDKDTEMPAQVHGNNKLEIIWTAIPALVVTVLFIASAMVLADVESTTEEPAVVLDVEAFQFGWTFKYMDPAEYDPSTDKYGETGLVVPFSPALASTEQPAPVMQEALLPVDVPVRFRLHSLDVIHSFYVPAFFFKRDVIPGRTNEFEITIEEPGVYGGQCAEFCGLSHGRMFFTIRAVEQADYDAWVAEKSPAGPATAEAEMGEDEPGVATEPAATPAQSDDGAAAGSVDEARVLEIGSTADKPIAFDISELQVQPGETVTVRYRNDSNIPHNIAFYDGDDATSATQIVQSETITGPDAVTEVTFTAPETPGEYLFRCELHPLQMVGTLVVSEAEPAAA